MPSDAVSHRFHGELASWWPLISPPEEYEEEAAFAARVLKSGSRPVHEVLEFGSGGGHNASVVLEETEEDRTPRKFFLGKRPSS